MVRGGIFGICLCTPHFYVASLDVYGAIVLLC